MVLVAELYNVELIKRNLVFKGVFDVLLPPNNKNLTSVELEGLCRLFKRCGPKLDRFSKKYVDKYIQKLTSHAFKFDFRTKVLVDEIKEMRSNEWKHRLKKEVAKTKEQIKEEFEEEQMATNNHSNYSRDKKSKRNRNKHRDRHYDDDEYAVNQLYHGYSSSNLRKKDRDRYQRRNDRRSQSSMNLRENRRSKKVIYDDNNSWDDNSGKNGTKWYQKKNASSSSSSSSNGKFVRSISDPTESTTNNTNTNGNTYGDSTTIHKLKGYISEYLASGDISDILDYLNETGSDYKVWASVINDGFRDRKSSEIEYFIQLIVELFHKKILNNKQNDFINVVVKYLCIQFDDSSMDCPNFKKYVGKLFANLSFNKYVIADKCYSYFIKKYQEYSEYKDIAKKKNINKLIGYSIEELQYLQASQSMINTINSCSL